MAVPGPHITDFPPGRPGAVLYAAWPDGTLAPVQIDPTTGSLTTAGQLTDSRYEWQLSGTTSVPLYIGTAPAGTDPAAPGWRIEKYTFITGPGGDPVPTVILAAVGAWTDRATLLP
jgi:hypothetical protein